MTEMRNGRWTFVPETGARVKMETFGDYSTRNVSIWAWLRITAVNGDVVTVNVLNGETPTDRTLDVPLSCISRPIGWQERYTIECGPDKVAEVQSWLARGIVVRFSHYMPSCPTAFQPLDSTPTADWRFNGSDSDAVTPDQVQDRIRILKVETWHDVNVPCPCEYCNGTGVRVAQAYHVGNVNLGSPKLGDTFACWTCDGGIGKRYLSQMTPKERKSVTAELKRNGWTIWYVRSGEACWVGERTTTVKEWGS